VIQVSSGIVYQSREPRILQDPVIRKAQGP